MTTPLDKSTLTGITRINVGIPETTFDIHIELLRSCSTFFDRLFKDHSLLEIQTNPVPLPHDDPDLFGDLVSWIYRGTISKYFLAEDTDFFLLRLWVLAARFEMPGLQNHVASHYLGVMNTQPGEVYDKAKIDFVYENTQPDSPLRRLVVDIWTRNGTQTGSYELLHSLSPTFLADLCGALFERKDTSSTPQMSFADFAKRYHVQILAIQDNSRKRLLESEVKEESNESNVPQRATAAQMERRKILTPKRRITSSPSALTVASDDLWKKRRMS
ncbi:uncharacterized protein LDX57_001136 [Aspergillus melleus]|uniref:uncharacterized protein n=1 Tax=Aspergillus melleus TaxID=138277 RepID=UPI001E8D31B4|nr:uncharacterized protein LDX57_001136 [Aspergillus melleus]KAH8423378.1 hypothetical protein LDX57_001136 [Aspergillus melleus]